jgi:hypothetical protein
MKSLFIRCLLLGLALWLSACATSPTITGQEVIYHSFEFDALRDSPNVEVLDYRYGSSNNLFVANTQERRAVGKSAQRTSITGEMLRGDDLYVKWRVNDTGKVYEDTVDLKSRLPGNINNHRIYFIIDGAQLYVYLISLFYVRDYLTDAEIEEDDRSVVNTHLKNLRGRARANVVRVYPSHQIIYPFRSKN